MRSRVVYYSRTGTTRLLAEALAARTVADSAEISCTRYGAGPWGWIMAGRASWRREKPPISFDPTDDQPDFLLVGGPVWAGVVAAPVRSYLARLGEFPGRVGIFLTSNGPPPHPQAEAEINALLGRTPDAVLAMQADDVKAGRHMDDVDDFLRDLAMHIAPDS